MKQIFFTVFLLLFAVCSCSQSGPSSSRNLTSPESSFSQESADVSEENTVQEMTGIAVRSDTRDFSFSRNPILGTEGDKKQFDAQIADLSKTSSRMILGLYSKGIEEEGQELTQDQVLSVFSALQNASYAVFDDPKEPSSGGTVHLLFLDEEENILLHASYDGGSWLTLEADNGPRVFDGSDCGLEVLFDP